MMLRQKLASIAVRIIYINNLYKKLCLAYNLNISSLKMHAQIIIIILQRIVILIKSCFILLPLHKTFNQLTRLVASRLPLYKVLDQLTLSVLLKLPIYEVSN